MKPLLAVTRSYFLTRRYLLSILVMQQAQLENAIALELKEAMFCHCSVVYKLFNICFFFFVKSLKDI